MLHRSRLFAQTLWKNAQQHLSQPQTKVELKRFARDLVVVAGTFHVVGTYLCSLTVCVGPSMMPTLDQHGDLVLVDKFSHVVLDTEYRKGDIVIAECPTDKHKTICKRIRGVSSDIVLVYPSNSAYPKIIRIPDMHVWLAGDNPANSTDSRNYGSVPQTLIKGRVIGKFTSQYPFFQKLSRLAPEDKTDYVEMNKRIEDGDKSPSETKTHQNNSKNLPSDPADTLAQQLLTERLERERDHVTGYQAVQAKRAIASAEDSGELSSTEAIELRRRFIGFEETITAFDESEIKLVNNSDIAKSSVEILLKSNTTSSDSSKKAVKTKEEKVDGEEKVSGQ